MHIPRLSSPVSRAMIDRASDAVAMGEIRMTDTCGTGWHEPLVPDRWGRADFRGACRYHDRCYETCGSGKADCDSAFLSDLRSACRDAYSSWLQRPLRRTCLELANTYHSAVHRMGGDAYRDAQRNSGCPS